MRSRLDGARYRRRLLVVILVATGMVCVKLVATSWKSERELAGEFNRWYDLVRPGADYFVNRGRLYNPQPLSVAEKHALRPIPMFR